MTKDKAKVSRIDDTFNAYGSNALSPPDGTLVCNTCGLVVLHAQMI